MVMKGAMLGGVATDDRVKSPSATTIQQPTYTVVSKVGMRRDIGEVWRDMGYI